MGKAGKAIRAVLTEERLKSLGAKVRIQPSLGTFTISCGERKSRPLHLNKVVDAARADSKKETEICAVCGKAWEITGTAKTKSWVGRESKDWPNVRPGSPICDACVLSRFPEAASERNDA